MCCIVCVRVHACSFCDVVVDNNPPGGNVVIWSATEGGEGVGDGGGEAVLGLLAGGGGLL